MSFNDFQKNLMGTMTREVRSAIVHNLGNLSAADREKYENSNNQLFSALGARALFGSSYKRNVQPFINWCGGVSLLQACKSVAIRYQCALQGGNSGGGGGGNIRPHHRGQVSDGPTEQDEAPLFSKQEIFERSKKVDALLGPTSTLAQDCQLTFTAFNTSLQSKMTSCAEEKKRLRLKFQAVEANESAALKNYDDAIQGFCQGQDRKLRKHEKKVALDTDATMEDLADQYRTQIAADKAKAASRQARSKKRMFG